MQPTKVIAPHLIGEVKMVCDRIVNLKGEAIAIGEKTWKSVLKYLKITIDSSIGWENSRCSLIETALLLTYFYSKKNKVISNPNNARPSEVQLKEVLKTPEHKQKIDEYFASISCGDHEKVFGRNLAQFIKKRTGVSITEKTLYEWGNNPNNPCPVFGQKRAYSELELSFWINSALKLSTSDVSKQSTPKLSSSDKKTEEKTSKRPPKKPPTLPMVPEDVSAKTILSEDARVICSVGLAWQKNEAISEDSGKIISKAQWQRHRNKLNCTNKWMSWQELSGMFVYEVMKESLEHYRVLSVAEIMYLRDRYEEIAKATKKNVELSPEKFMEDASDSEAVQQCLVQAIKVARINSMIRC